MEHLNFFLSHGLWSVVEELFNAPEKVVKEDDKLLMERLILELATRPNQRRITCPTLRHPWQLSWLASTLIHKLITLDSQELRSVKWFADQKLSRSDMDRVKKVSEMHGLVYNLPEPVSIELKNDIIQLYVGVISVDDSKSQEDVLSSANPRGISVDTLEYLRKCLIKNPAATNLVIQRLLCMWSSSFAQSDCLLQDVYETAFDELLKSFDSENPEDACKLYCLLTIFEVSEEKEKNIVERIFPKLLDLCYSKKISLSQLYLSLLGRGKFGLLRVLVGMEAERQKLKHAIGDQDKEHGRILHNFVENGLINMRKIFLRAYKRNVPWNEDIVEVCVHAMSNDGLDAVKDCLSNSGLKTLWPAVLFEIWERFLKNGKTDVDLYSIMEECQHCVEDKEVVNQISQMEHCLRFSEWIIASGCAKTDVLASVLEKVTNSCCAAHALKQVARLQDLKEDCVMKALVSLRGDSTKNDDAYKLMVQTEISTLRGYFIAMTVYEAILSSIEADNDSGPAGAISQGATKSKYDENVKEKLGHVKSSLSQLYPLTFRVEVLELMFSLLFLERKDILEENTSDSGGEESDGAPVDDKARAPLHPKEEQGAKDGSDLQRPPVLPLASAKRAKPHHSTTRRSKSDSSCSEVSGSVHVGQGGASLHVCGPRVVRDLLQCLKECLVDASVALFGLLTKVDAEGRVNNVNAGRDVGLQGNVPSSMSQEMLQKRMARLSQYVGEAACRLEIVSPGEELPLKGRKASPSPLHPFWHNLPGTMGKPVWAFVDRGTSDESADEGSRVGDLVGRTAACGMYASASLQASYRQEAKCKHRRRSRSENERSSESGSQSHATGGSGLEGSKKRRRGWRMTPQGRRLPGKGPRVTERAYCGFCQSSKGRTLPQPLGIIDRMLASPRSLVIQCLSLGEIVKAKKVVEIFKLEESALAKEVMFLEGYVPLLHKLERKTKECNLNDEASSSSTFWNSPLQSVKLAATAGMYSTSFSNIVEGFMSTVILPTVEGLEVFCRDNPQLANCFSEMLLDEPQPSHSIDYTAAILIDLAVTYPGTANQSSSLFDIALKHCPTMRRHHAAASAEGNSAGRHSRLSPFHRGLEFQASSSSPSSHLSNTFHGPVGFVTFLHNTVQTLKIVNDHCCQEDGLWSLIETPLFCPRRERLSIPDLVATSLPLNPDSVALCLSFWEDLFKGVQEFEGVVGVDTASDADSVSTSRMGDSEVRRRMTLKELHASKVNSAFSKIISISHSVPWHAEGVLWREHGRRLSGSREPQYLQMLFMYLKMISSLMVQSSLHGKGFIVPSNYFDVLSEHIDSIVGKLVFECDVHPSRLESMASKMNLDLVLCIMKNCCPPVKSVVPPLECMELNRTGKVANKWGRVILNPIPKDWHGPSRTPNALVEALLSELLNELQKCSRCTKRALSMADMATVLQSQSICDLLFEGTQELAIVDMDLLRPGDESLIFFVNLANLLTLHAVILLEVHSWTDSDHEAAFAPFGLLSHSHSECLLARMSVCYNVSSLGAVSIHSMCQVVLGEDLSLDLARLSSWRDFSLKPPPPRIPLWPYPPHPSLLPFPLPPPRPDLLFALATGHAHSTIVPSVLCASTVLDTQVHTLITDHLGAYTRVACGSVLSVSWLTWLRCKGLHNGGEEECPPHVKAAEHLSEGLSESTEWCVERSGASWDVPPHFTECVAPALMDFLLKHVDGQLKADVTELHTRLNQNTGQDLEFVVKVIIPDSTPCINFDYSKALSEEACKKNYKDVNMQVSSVPKSVSSNWSWSGGALPTAVLEYLELRCWPLAVIAALANTPESSLVLPPLMPHATSLKHLLMQGVLNYPETLDHLDGIVAILSPEGLPSPRLWATLDANLPSMRNLPTKQLLGLLQTIPQPRLLEEPKVAVFHDLVLWEISSREPEADMEEPWRFGIRIQDPVVRVACVLHNITLWARNKEGSCREALLSLCRNRAVEIPARTKALLLETLKKIEVYEKILAHTKSETVRNWYDVCQLLENDPGAVLQNLIQAKQLTLFLKWTELHPPHENVLNLIGPNILLLLLHTDPVGFNSANKLLQLLPLHQAAALCQGSLPYLRSPLCLHFVLSFLLESCHSVLSEEELVHYEQWSVGLIMVSHRLLLGNGKHKRQRHSTYGHVWSWLDLAPTPLLILEQLLMNVQLEALEGTLGLLRPHLRHLDGTGLAVAHVDALLRQYAAKALDFRVCITQVHRGDVKLTPQLPVPPPSFKTSESISSLSISTTNVRSSEGRPRNESVSSGSNHSFDLAFQMPAKVPSKAEWVPNDEVTVCMCCQIVSFSMFNRRHHCRRCGRVVCGLCSSQRLKVEGYLGVPVRVCDDCQSVMHLSGKKVAGYEDVLVRVCNSCHGQRQRWDEPKEEEEVAEEVGEEDEEEGPGEGGWYWRLTGEEAQDAMLRDEFGFEQAPSVSLCLAILQHHSPGDPAHPRLLLDSAENLLTLLCPSPHAQNSLNPEVDHALVVQMVRSLAVASKVLYSRIGMSTGVERCDFVIGRAGLLNVLVRSGWAGAGEWVRAFLEPQGGGPSGETEDPGIVRSASVGRRPPRDLTRLRDRLVHEEQWELALEVGTKGGLGRAGIWAAWGKACLRVGGWKQARSLFDRCLQKGTNATSAARPPTALTTSPASLLAEILKILEEGSVVLPMPLEDSSLDKTHPYPSVLQSLASLDAICKGKIPLETLWRPAYCGPLLSEDVRKECLYYLHTYGTDSMVLQFHLRHCKIRDALFHFLNAHMNPEAFLDDVYLHCFHKGWILELEMEMKTIDQSLERWKPHLCCMCRLLEHRGMLQILYKVQVFAEDNVRAAMTCIRFYCKDIATYSQMRQNCVHLRSAQKHMEEDLGSTIWVEKGILSSASSSASSSTTGIARVSPRRKTSLGTSRRKTSETSVLPLKMDPRELDHHINTIRRQEEVAKFLANCEAAGKAVVSMASKLADRSPLKTLPTLFGSTTERVHLAVLAIVCGKDVEEGFGIAFRVIQDYNLRAVGVFELAGKMLASEGRPRELEHLLSCIKSSGISDCTSTCDQVAFTCIHAVTNLCERIDAAECAEEEDSSSEDRPVEKSLLASYVRPLLKVITNPKVKISACIACGQLTKAYHIAATINSNADIEWIAKEAEKLGDSHTHKGLHRICIKRLEMAKKT